MTTFTNGGHAYTLRPSVGLFAQVTRETGFDALRGVTPDGFQAAAMAPPLAIVDAIWLLCESEAAERGVDKAAFVDEMGPQSVDDALEALLSAAMDFLPATTRAAMKGGIREILKNAEAEAGKAAAKASVAKAGSL